MRYLHNVAFNAYVNAQCERRLCHLKFAKIFASFVIPFYRVFQKSSNYDHKKVGKIEKRYVGTSKLHER